MLFLASDLSQPVSGRAASTLLLCLLSTISAINLPSYVTSSFWRRPPIIIMICIALVWLFPFVSGLSSPSLIIVKHLPWLDLMATICHGGSRPESTSSSYLSLLLLFPPCSHPSQAGIMLIIIPQSISVLCSPFSVLSTLYGETMPGISGRWRCNLPGSNASARHVTLHTAIL